MNSSSNVNFFNKCLFMYFQGGGELVHTFLLDTPLAVAALEGDHELFRLLLVRGALPAISVGVMRIVQDAHNVPRLITHECRSCDRVKERMLRTFHLFGGDPMQRLRNGDTPYCKYKARYRQDEFHHIASFS